MSLYSLMESYGTLKRPTIGRDTTQGVTQSPFVNVSGSVNIPCSVQQASGRTQEIYAQRNIFVTTTLYFPRDPHCQVNDRFEATDRTGVTSIYLIRGVTAQLGRGRVWQVEAELIQ